MDRTLYSIATPAQVDNSGKKESGDDREYSVVPDVSQIRGISLFATRYAAFSTTYGDIYSKSAWAS